MHLFGVHLDTFYTEYQVRIFKHFLDIGFNNVIVQLESADGSGQLGVKAGRIVLSFCDFRME